MKRTIAIIIGLTFTATANAQRGRGSFPPAPAPYHAVGAAAKNPVAKATLWRGTMPKVNIVNLKGQRTTNVQHKASKVQPIPNLQTTSYGAPVPYSTRGTIDGPRFLPITVYVGTTLVETAVDDNGAFRYRMGRMARMYGKAVTLVQDGKIISVINP